MSLGLDLHGDAVSAIGTSVYIYKRYTGRTVNTLGVWTSGYAADQTMTGGNVQPVALKELNQNGLDTSKEYIKIWDNIEFQSLDRGQGADRCEYRGDLYEIVPATTNWFGEDGWCESLWVKQ